MQERVAVPQKSFQGLDELPAVITSAKPISSTRHSLIDYLSLIILLIVPPALRFPKSVVRLYRAQALILLPYAALTDQPLALKRLIPFPVHGKIDAFNVGMFTLQSFLNDFKKDKRALLFNTVLIAITGVTVFFTDWNGKTKMSDLSEG